MEVFVTNNLDAGCLSQSDSWSTHSKFAAAGTRAFATVASDEIFQEWNLLIPKTMERSGNFSLSCDIKEAESRERRRRRNASVELAHRRRRFQQAHGDHRRSGVILIRLPRCSGFRAIAERGHGITNAYCIDLTRADMFLNLREVFAIVRGRVPRYFSVNRELIMHRWSLSSIDWSNMEKLTRLFSTEPDFDRDASQLITDGLDCPIPKIARSEISNRGQLATSGRISLPAEKVSLRDEAHVRSNSVSEIARIAIKAKGRVLFVNPSDVVMAKSEGNYVALVHKSGSYFVRETMATAEQKLTPMGFVRVHRSILVNTALVRDLRRDNTGTYVLRTTDGREHPVGRAYKGNLKLIAKAWMGVDLM